MKLIYPAIFTPYIENDGYTVNIPDLPGCVSEGYDLENAIEMGTDAACGWILGELEDGNSIPLASSPKNIEYDEDSFITFLILDMDLYSEKYGKKSVRKNITIPAWLNTFGEKNNINFSKVLQESLIKMCML